MTNDEEDRQYLSSSSYNRVRDAAWRTLLETGIDALPVDVFQVCARENIHIQCYRKAQEVLRLFSDEAQLDRSDGLSFCLDGEDYILYDDTTSRQRQRYTIAHEIGHCILGHFELYASGRPYDPALTDKEAELFAIHLLAPSCVLWGTGIFSAPEIAALCNISHAAAEKKARRMQALSEREKKMQKEKGRSCFLASALEQQVYLQFQAYLKLRNLRQEQAETQSSDSG